MRRILRRPYVYMDVFIYFTMPQKSDLKLWIIVTLYEKLQRDFI